MNRRMREFRWRPRSIRWRLTLLYSALFVVAGSLLLGFVYFLAAHSAGSPSRTITSVEGPGVSVADGAPAPPATVRAVAEVVRRDQLHDLLVYTVLALAVMALASLALGWLMAGRVLSPLRSMTATARRISADNLHERLAVGGPEDELKAVADTFDDVLARLEGAFEAQKQFVANASHELRTPLTLQQTIVDVTLADPDATEEALRAALRRVRAAGQEQERLIDALLTLARSQRGLEQREFVDLAEVVGERLPVGGPRVEARLEAAPVLGDPQLIERLVVNLIENAVRHNLPAGEGGWVTVWTGVDVAGVPGLRIENSGPVIPADQAAGLFQPFRRLGPDRVRKRDGLGLGMSIVAAVVTAHGGRVRARTRPTGGLTVEVTLPCCERTAPAPPVASSASAAAPPASAAVSPGLPAASPVPSAAQPVPSAASAAASPPRPVGAPAPSTAQSATPSRVAGVSASAAASASGLVGAPVPPGTSAAPFAESPPAAAAAAPASGLVGAPVPPGTPSAPLAASPPAAAASPPAAAAASSPADTPSPPAAAPLAAPRPAPRRP
ncbi:sensor histidine kinase [Streptomyces sp. NPDC057257]|uniref:sensor histidine kinase n=1 Tax=Streptomyces sp. NPDC057257 TaxID=3346071 RepID=UPI0036260E4D